MCPKRGLELWSLVYSPGSCFVYFPHCHCVDVTFVTVMFAPTMNKFVIGATTSTTTIPTCTTPQLQLVVNLSCGYCIYSEGIHLENTINCLFRDHNYSFVCVLHFKLFESGLWLKKALHNYVIYCYYSAVNHLSLLSEAQLLADDIWGCRCPVIITHCAPGTVASPDL